MRSNYDRNIFVFGALEAGRHGKGSALYAKKKHGAIYGQGFGLQGDSFGIPTKDSNLRVLNLERIEVYVEAFLEFAKRNPTWLFHVVPFGTQLACYNRGQTGGILRKHGLPDNVVLTHHWLTD